MSARAPINPIGGWREDTSLHQLCPRCERRELPIGYNGALSRADNVTEVCSACGTDEAMHDAFGFGHQATNVWPVRQDHPLTADIAALGAAAQEAHRGH